MAKKYKTRSWQDIEADLRLSFASPTPAHEVPYLLLRALGRSEAQLNRYRVRKDIVRTFNGLLIRGELGYRAVTDATLLGSTLQAMKGETHVLSAQPKILCVSDGVTLLAWDTREEESYENSLSGLWADFRFFYPLMGIERTHVVAELEADVRAAQKLGRLHDELRAQNDFATAEELHGLNLFITRLLFCFFAEDTGIFPEGLFTDSVRQYTQEDGSDLGAYLDDAFAMMNQRERLGLANRIVEQFPYVNGGLFAQRTSVPTMTRHARRLILECGALDWRSINPDIFGSMIQAVADAELRSSVGMHYTSVPNIRKVIDPLFLGELRATFDGLRRRYEEVEHDFSLGVISQGERAKRLKALKKPCDALLERMSRMRFFDPACGSGNFLIITYKELRLLEMDIIKLQRDCQGLASGLDFVGSSVIRLDQFYGIELLDFPHEVACLSLWLAEHQMNKLLQERFGKLIEALPLRSIAHIHRGNACRLDWHDICPHSPEDEVYLFGNPPYLGASLMNKEQKEEVLSLWGKRGASIDYIGNWFFKGAKYIAGTMAKCGFVSTNSICQGEQVELIWPTLLETTEIEFAHTSFKWGNNATGNAGVTCIIIGLAARGHAGSKHLYSGSEVVRAKSISPYLTPSEVMIVAKHAKPLSPNIPEIRNGNKPSDGGALILNAAERDFLTEQDPSLAKFIRPYIGSQELIRDLRRYCFWIEDHEVEEAKQHPEIAKRLRQVTTFREQSTEASTRELAKQPHRFYFISQQELPRIVIPSASSETRDYIPMDYWDGGDRRTIIPNSALAIYGAPFWLFAVLTSRMHMAWVRTIGGRLKTDYRYSAQICYNTFPFPEVSEADRKALEEVAEGVLLCRADFPGKTLAELYDPKAMPESLREAHDAVDVLVDRLYRPTGFATDEERLAELFGRYARATQ